MRRHVQLNKALGAAALIALLTLPTIGSAQDWNDEGSITSRQYRRQIREGRQVAATEFFTLEYSVQTMLVEGGRGGPVMVCVNRCNGDKHDKHEDCDNSCDETCEEDHEVTRKGSYEPDRGAMRAATRAANALARRGGGSHSPSDWSSRVSRSLANLRREARKEITWEMPHGDPCSGRKWWVGTQNFSFVVRGTMTKVGYTMRRGVRTPINEVVGTHELTVATAAIAQEDPFTEHEWENCKCKPVEEIDLGALIDLFGDMFEGLPELLDSTKVGPSGVDVTGPEGEEVDEEEVEIEILPLDLNGCYLDVTNGTMHEISVSIPIGTTFVSEDSSVQDMASLVGTSGVVPPGETVRLYVSLSPVSNLASARIPVRWACLDIDKKQPGPGDKFTIEPPENDVVQRLAVITNRSRLRGPHDQARIWIYTDSAPIDEINKRLSPEVSTGRYATLLWEVSTVGGVDISSRSYKKCLEPKLLAGIPIDDRATNWLVGELTATDARGFARYVDRNASDLTDLLDASPEFAPSHLATMVVAMGNSGQRDVEKAATKFMRKVPDEHRELLASAGALRGLMNQLASKDRKMVEDAVEVLLKYPPEYANDLLGAQWEQLPTEKLREKVREHLGIEPAA